MYGLVNKAIQDLVCHNYGEDVWDEILETADVDVDLFISMESYDDSVTYKLVGAASKVLKSCPTAILEAFGKYWMTFTGAAGYGDFFTMTGNSFSEFLHNLDNLHTRVGLIYTDLQMPSFTCKDISDNELLLEYRSERDGLSHFVIGLLQGLGERFKISLDISQTKTKEEAGYDEFSVKYHPILEAIVA